MVDPQIEKLLIVQHRDVDFLKIQQDLARLPTERTAMEAVIKREEADIEVARQALLSKELKRKEMDAELNTKEATLLRFRTQQSEVKKNDEYKALSHEIEQTEAAISELEESEIELLLEIDIVKEQFEKEKAEIQERIVAQRKEIDRMTEREAVLKASLEDAGAKVAEARIVTDASYLEQYDRVKKTVKRPPFVTPIEAHKCTGCHLKVSNEVALEVLKADEPHFCDQCARIVYV